VGVRGREGVVCAVECLGLARRMGRLGLSCMCRREVRGAEGFRAGEAHMPDDGTGHVKLSGPSQSRNITTFNDPDKGLQVYCRRSRLYTH